MRPLSVAMLLPAAYMALPRLGFYLEPPVIKIEISYSAVIPVKKDMYMNLDIECH